jgi:hypothetical protein
LFTAKFSAIKLFEFKKQNKKEKFANKPPSPKKKIQTNK